MCEFEGEKCCTEVCAVKQEIMDIIKGLPFFWVGDRQNLQIGKDQLLDMIERVGHGES